MKRGLIIFVRTPELGKVKTRLAVTLGDEHALRIYKDLLQHTHDVALPVEADKFIYYADKIEDNDLWSAPDFNKRLQSGDDLGGRMKSAFAGLFNNGYNKLIIIGSDCPKLTTAIIEDAFAKLIDHDAVIGPANDGGYYLLGMKKPLPFIFENKLWSTEQVYPQTISDLQREKISFHSLIQLRDVDTEEDWIITKQNAL